MFLRVEPPKTICARTLFERALQRGVAFVPGDAFYTDGRARLNYTNASTAQIEEGIKRRGETIKEML